MVMTPEELTDIETNRPGWMEIKCVPLLCAEVRACWAAISDLRQDSEAYRRAIVDAVRVLSAICDRLPSGEAWAELKDAAAEVADLALTRDEFERTWDGEPVPTGVVYDAHKGFRGTCYDAVTGEEIRNVVRACPERGWYETVRAEGRQLITERHWRNVRVKPYIAKEKVTG